MPAKIDADYCYIPEPYRGTFRYLADEYYYITEVAREYNLLFGDESRIDYLNKSAPFLFWLIQNTFYDNLILSLTRLLDRAEMGDDENLSLCHLICLLKNNLRWKLASDLETRLEEIKSAAKPLCKQRSKRIIHNDKKFALVKNKVLPPVPWGLIQSTILGVHEILSKFDKDFGGIGIEELTFDECDGAVRLWDYLIKIN